MIFPRQIKQIKKRDGRIVDFEQSRITNAVYKAMQAAGEGNLQQDPVRVSDKVVQELLKRFPADHIPQVEEIQDVVEETLIVMDFPKTAKAYILYRSERAKVRQKAKVIPDRVKQLAAASKKYFRNQLAEFIYYRTYSRWIPEEGRRETWIETVQRYIDFMKENLGRNLSDEEYEEVRQAILKQEVMPSMRLMWAAGKAARATNVSVYNCSFIAPNKLRDFSEIMYLLMCGTGVGFSVESQTAQQLPIIKRQTGEKLKTHVIDDSKEGWGDALYLGLKTWYEGRDIAFDYSKLRPAGARLKTMGGRSSGPEPLRALLDFARERILKRQGRRLTNLDVHDIVCKIGELVVMGGVRRSALISLSDLDDAEMRDAKKGQFYLNNPQRSMANNSAVYNEKPSTQEFMEEWLALAQSGSGERGIFNRGGLKVQLPERRWKTFEKHWQTSGTNPCLTGDSLVYVADGRGHVPIKELAEKGEDVPVFCLNKRGGVEVRMMRHPRLTGEKAPVYKVVLEDGSMIRTTADHKFKLRSGEYKEVKDLQRGDSLYILTKFEASIKDVFAQANSRSQDYWWINTGRTANEAEHRLIAEFYYNTKVPAGYVVHHKDWTSQKNKPQNLIIISKKEHDAIHGEKMMGDNNPMRRAQREWNEIEWKRYSKNMSATVSGMLNGRFSGITNEQLKQHALLLTKKIGRRFSNKDWVEYASQNNLPQHFSAWRKTHLGGILGLAKWAAQELGFEHIEVDPRVSESYKRYTSQGYDCKIIDGQLFFIKRCEFCKKEFCTRHREHGACSPSCGLKQKWTDKEFAAQFITRLRNAHRLRKERIKEIQAGIFSDLRFSLGRDPLKAEWMAECKRRGISPEISRISSPARKYQELKDFAAMYNHKVISVELAGYEDVYNGTVDEFHNFFVGGFESKTINGKRKFIYLNNLQCGEIVLRNKQYCNLTEVVCRPEDTQESLLKKIRLATILGTYQSTLTDFPYISKEWKKNCEEERLLGVSLTGQWDCPEVRKAETLRKLRQRAIEVNQEYAKRFGINFSTAITAIKPSGTVSQLVDAASGMHPRHAPYYIRRVRISATDPLFHMMRDQKFPYHPEVGQLEQSATTYVFDFPVKAPAGSVFRNDLNAINQLEHWKVVKDNYTEHNPSVTISVGEEEWLQVANWLYNNWEILGGLSFLPRFEHVYKLAPYEDIDENRYNALMANFPKVDFSHIVAYEQNDETQGAHELACVAGVCEADDHVHREERTVSGGSKGENNES